MTKIWRTASVYCCVLIAVDRGLALKWPLKSKRFYSRKRVQCSILAVVFFAICLNIPAFFYYYFDSNERQILSRLAVVESWYYRNLYANGIYLALMYILPLLLLCALNMLIIHSMKGHLQLTGHKSSLNDSYKHRRNQTNEVKQITLIAVVIILRFVISNSIIVAGYFLQIFNQPAFKTVGIAGNLLVITDSASNLLIYCAVAKRYRRMFFQFYVKCRSPREVINSDEYRRLSCVNPDRRRSSTDSLVHSIKKPSVILEPSSTILPNLNYLHENGTASQI